jgi:hypothetical protein
MMAGSSSSGFWRAPRGDLATPALPWARCGCNLVAPVNSKLLHENLINSLVEETHIGEERLLSPTYDYVAESASSAPKKGMWRTSS